MEVAGSSVRPVTQGFSRQEYWIGLPCPPPGVFLTQGLNLHLLHILHWQVGSLPLAPPGNLLFLLLAVIFSVKHVSELL